MDASHHDAGAKGFVPFAEFLAGALAARFEDYKDAPGARVADEASFEEMKRHLASLYRGVSVRLSFLHPDGHHVDCVPIEQQPGLCRSPPPSLGCTAPPGTPGAAGPAPPEAPAPEQERFGQETSCPEGTVPMRRITLEELTRFRTLRQFLGK
jgi:hypothetical protein